MTQCDEPGSAPVTQNPAPDALSADIGSRRSARSARPRSAIVNPQLNGWFALGGGEINEQGGCVPEGNGLDSVTVGGAGYLLQRELTMPL